MSVGGVFSNLQQSGHGTMDSGYTNLSGYNEVIMLRQLPEGDKKKACQLIPSHATDDTLRKRRGHNILHQLPYDVGPDVKLMWPTDATVEAWEKLGYVPDRSSHLHCPKSIFSYFVKNMIAPHAVIVLRFLF
jgi:hypothetical protein